MVDILRHIQAAIVSSTLLVTASVAQDFYPLQGGNVWQYKTYFQGDSLPGYDEVTISRDTLVPNGKHYFYFRPSFCLGGFQRIDDSGNVYLLDVGNIDGDSTTEEVLFDRMRSSVGEFWWGYRFSAIPLRQTYSVKEGFYTTTLFGTEVAVMQIAYYIPYGNVLPGFFAGRVHYSSKFGIIYAAVEGGAAYELRGARLGGITYGLLVNVQTPEDHIPDGITLANAYPNPFNAGTLIRFTLNQATQVRLSIFNPLGQLVSEYLPGILTCGDHTFRWQPDNLPSGVYYYRLQAGSAQVTKKLLYLK